MSYKEHAEANFYDRADQLAATLRYDGIISRSMICFACGLCEFTSSDYKLELSAQAGIARDGSVGEALDWESLLLKGDIAMNTTAAMVAEALPEWQVQGLAAGTTCDSNFTNNDSCDGELFVEHHLLPSNHLN